MRLVQFLGRRETSLAVQSITLTAARFVGFVFTFAIPLVLVRVFSQSEFGVYKQVFLVAVTVMQLLQLGMAPSLYYFVPRDEGGGRKYVMQAAILMSLTGALGGLAVLVGAPIIGRLFDTPAFVFYLPLIALYILIATPARLVSTVPTVHRRSAFAGSVLAASDLVRATAVIAAALIGRSLEAVLWAAIGTEVLRAFGLAVYLRLWGGDSSERPSFRSLVPQLRYALPFAVAMLFELGLDSFHQYYVAASVSASDFAIYAVGLLNVPVLGMMVHSVVEVMIIRASTAYRAGDLEELRRLWRTAVERLAVVILPCWALGQVFAADAIGLLFGMAYLPSVPILRVFLSTLLLLLIVDHGILRATGDTGYVLKALMLGFGASVVALLVLTPKSMMLGAIAAYVVGLLVARLVGLVRVAHRLDVRVWSLVPLRSLARIGAATAGASIAATAAFAIEPTIPRLMAGGVLFAAIYGALVYRWELVPRAELRALLARVPIRRVAGAGAGAS